MPHNYDSADFFEHLNELRSAITRILISLIFFIVPAFFFAESFVLLLMRPLVVMGEKIHYFSPHEGFLLRSSAALLLACMADLPYIIFEIFRFVLPALKKKEQRLLFKSLIFMLLLPLFGAAFAYFVVIPVSLRFLLSFGGDKGHFMLSAGGYFSYFASMLIGFMFLFEWPLFSFIMVQLKVFTAERLKKFRIYIVATAFILGAVLTPPDVLSQFLFAVPFIILYEISFYLAAFYERKGKVLM